MGARQIYKLTPGVPLSGCQPPRALSLPPARGDTFGQDVGPETTPLLGGQDHRRRGCRKRTTTDDDGQQSGRGVWSSQPSVPVVEVLDPQVRVPLGTPLEVVRPTGPRRAGWSDPGRGFPGGGQNRSSGRLGGKCPRAHICVAQL